MPVPETIVTFEKGTQNDPILIHDEDVDHGKGAGTAHAQIKVEESYVKRMIQCRITTSTT
jgi:hypothetical protein